MVELYLHHDVNSVYRSSGPIFIRENALTERLKTNKLPEMLTVRPQSIRAYNSKNEMIDAVIENGDKIKVEIVSFLKNDNILEKYFL